MSDHVDPNELLAQEGVPAAERRTAADRAQLLADFLAECRALVAESGEHDECSAKAIRATMTAAITEPGWEPESDAIEERLGVAAPLYRPYYDGGFQYDVDKLLDVVAGVALQHIDAAVTAERDRIAGVLEEVESIGRAPMSDPITPEQESIYRRLSMAGPAAVASWLRTGAKR